MDKYYQRNKEKCLKRMKKYQKENPDKVKACSKTYYQNNKDKWKLIWKCKICEIDYTYFEIGDKEKMICKTCLKEKSNS